MSSDHTIAIASQHELDSATCSVYCANEYGTLIYHENYNLPYIIRPEHLACSLDFSFLISNLPNRALGFHGLEPCMFPVIGAIP